MRNGRIVALVFVIVCTGCGGKLSAESSSSQESGRDLSNGISAESSVRPNAAPSPLSTGLYCKKQQSRDGTVTTYKYESIFYPTGDRYVSCQITVPSTQAVNSMFYKSTQIGANTGECFVTYDDNGPTSGYWAFSSQNGMTQVTYNDATSPENNFTYTFFDADCTRY